MHVTVLSHEQTTVLIHSLTLECISDVLSSRRVHCKALVKPKEMLFGLESRDNLLKNRNARLVAS